MWTAYNMWARQECLVHNSRWVVNFLFFTFFADYYLYSRFLACVEYITIKQQYISIHKNTARFQKNNLLTTSILDTLEKALWDLIEEQHRISKLLWDLVEE